MKCPDADRKSPRNDEAGARALVERHIEGRLVHVDPPDFLISRFGDVVGGLEVTTAMHEGLARLGAQPSRFEDSAESDLLDYSWTAAVSWTDADLRRWDFDRFVMLVKAVEQRGFQSDRQADSLIRDDFARSA